MQNNRLAVLFSVALAGLVATTTVQAQDAAAGDAARGAVLADTWRCK